MLFQKNLISDPGKAVEEEILHFVNKDLTNIVTPVDADVLHDLLMESKYDVDETNFLVSGFQNGFSLGYSRKEKVKLTSRNLKLRTGNETILWNKVMKEVKAERYAGPFTEIPFEDDFIQSPIGLVLKDGGKACRLIFHLSHPKNGKDSVNINTPHESCRVNYAEFDHAVKLCMGEGVGCHVGKSDMKSAFRNLGILKRHWRYLILKVRDPKDRKTYYFIDKCLPFGAAISCVHFQRFSNAMAHLVRWRMKQETRKDKPVINYLDDFLLHCSRLSVTNRWTGSLSCVTKLISRLLWRKLYGSIPP